MKKSTGILFLVLVILAVGAYFYETKGPKPKQDPNAEGARPTFDVRQEDINQITITRGGVTMVCDLKNDGWHISQPVSVYADQSALGDIANTLSIVPRDRVLSATQADLNNYGLANPVVTVSFKLRNGTTHKLEIGNKDFSNLEVYARVDDSKDVSLVSNIIANTVDKPVEDFRDHMALEISADSIESFDLTNDDGSLSAKKDDNGWTIEKPVVTPASNADIMDMLGNVATAQVTHFVDDHATDLAKYGLANPGVRFRATLPDGRVKELLIGSKDGDEYYAEDTSQPVVFRVQQALREALTQSFADLRAKVLYTEEDGSASRLELHNSYGTIVCAKDPNDAAFVIVPAPGQKGPAIPCPKFMDTLERTSSGKIYDQPSADLAAKLAKPAIEMSVTDDAGRKTDIQISAPSGGSVYGRSSVSGATIYEFDKQAFDSLNVKPSGAK